MTALRRLSYATLVLAFAQIMFGAIVRITGSGMGCGDHWPKCNGHWFPPYYRTDLIIEITHRHIAAALTVAILALFIMVFRRRHQPGVSGPRGLLRPVSAAVSLVVVAAIFGAITVKMGLNPYIIVTHLAIAMTLLAVLAITVIRAGGFGSRSLANRTGSANAARAAAIMAFITLVFGALTANVGGANNACRGFPWCTAIEVHGMPLTIQVIHRLLAFVLLFHAFGMVMAARKRQEQPLVQQGTRIVFGVVLAQIVVAAILVELHLPAVWRSAHQAMGTLVWLTTFTFAALTRMAARGERVVRRA